MKELPAGNEQSIFLTQQEPAQEHALTMREFLDILRRRWAIASQVFVLVVALGVGEDGAEKGPLRTGAPTSYARPKNEVGPSFSGGS